MSTQRKKYSPEFKAKAALEALKGLRTISEIAGDIGVHPIQIGQWKKHALEGLPGAFSGPSSKDDDSEELVARLYQEIGQLKVELDWLKKSQDGSVEVRRRLIDPDHPVLSLARQCELLGLSRSSWYYQAREESAENVLLMRLLDEQYTKTPFYGTRRMTEWLGVQGYEVNRKRIRRLLHKMGLETIYPGPRLSEPNPGHRIYPYLLRGVPIVRPDQVWSTDITYIRLRSGFVYLTAIIDWFSRYVLAWELSNTLDVEFFITALERALRQGRPEIFNTDQGSQYTSQAFTAVVLSAGARISMDGRGRALDNVFAERLWRSVKYEEVYIKDYETVPVAFGGLAAYFRFYNTERLHQSLGYQTPDAVYRGAQAAQLAPRG